MNLIRIRWAVRGALFLGVAASIAGNVLHAQDTLVSQIISAWSPIALLITIELISRIPVHRRSLALARWAATALIAGIAAWVSYWHMAAVASRYGETGASPYLLPLSVDGLVVVASICLVELAGRIREEQDRPEVAHPAIDAPVIPTPKAPVFLSPVSAPPALSDEPVSGAPAADEIAGPKVRQDMRTAQQIEVAVCAMRQAQPRLSQRKIAEAVMVPATTVRRILTDLKAEDVAHPGEVNGKVPAFIGAGDDNGKES